MCNVYVMCMCVGGGRCGCVGIMSVLACVCNVYVMCMYACVLCNVYVCVWGSERYEWGVGVEARW